MVDEAKSQDDALSEEKAFDIVGASVFTGVSVVPLILPGGDGQTKFLFCKFQIRDSDGDLVLDELMPLDVVTVLSLNLIRACSTALSGVGEVSSDNLVYSESADLRDAASESLSALKNIIRILSPSSS